MKINFSLIFILVLVLLPIFPVPPSLAAPDAFPSGTITVTITADEFGGTGTGCSLREAIQSANTDTAFGGCAAGSGADVISLPAGTYTLRGAADEDLNASGDLDIDSDLTINGADARTTIIQAGTNETNGVDRVLHTIGDVTVEINAVTVRYGNTIDGLDGVGDYTCSGANGGGIFNSVNSTLIMNDSIVIFNRTGDGGDSCTSGIASYGAGGNGGGIYVLGSLELNNTGVRWNVTGTGGNGATGSIGYNGGNGGGIYIHNSSIVTITNSTVGYNLTGDGGRSGDGDPTGGDADDAGDGGKGGGIYSRYAILSLNDVSVVENTTGLGGAGGDAALGNGGDGGYGGTGAGIYYLGNVLSFVTESSVQGNETGLGGSGGSGSVADGTTRNYPGPAGGIYSGIGTAVTLVDTYISENYGMNGGVMNTGSGTEMILDGCTISANHSAGYAGGIYNGSTSTLRLRNSTLSANLADDHGGAIFNGGGPVSLLHTTITGNITDQDNNGSGNGGGFYSGGTFTMTHTIVAENTDMGGSYPDCYGTVISGDYNLLGIGDNANCTFPAQAHDQVGTTAIPLDPMLDTLDDNGGNTATHALFPASPAVDMIPPASCPLVVDQRGYSRPVDYDGDGTAQCDIGAVEIRKYYLLTVGLAGAGQGSVQSLPFGIGCGEGNSDCNELYDINTVVTLTASASLPSAFAGWSGDCSGLDLTCAIKMNQTHSVTATFDLVTTVPTYTLSIDLLGDGAGNVSSAPTGIDCGTGSEDCAAVFSEGTIITLTAATATDSLFAGWGGDCTGMNLTCAITMHQTHSVTATFDLVTTVPTHTLSINLVGDGAGYVGSEPDGIDCGEGNSDCLAVFYEGTIITLTAAATVDSSFVGWGGDLSGADNPVLITMDSPKTVEANFTNNTTEWRIYLPLVIR